MSNIRGGRKRGKEGEERRQEGREEGGKEERRKEGNMFWTVVDIIKTHVTKINEIGNIIRNLKIAKGI